MINDERQVWLKEIHDFEVFKNTMKEAVEQMDVWNAWDNEVVETLGKEKDLREVLDAKQTLFNRESIIDLAWKSKSEKKDKIW